MDFKELFASVEGTAEYAEESAILEFTEELVRLMAQKGLSRADLARRLECSPAYVTKVLRGGGNLTLASMTKLAQAIECDLRLRLLPKGHSGQWFEFGNIAENKRVKYKTGSEMLKEKHEYSTTSGSVTDSEVIHDRISIAS